MTALPGDNALAASAVAALRKGPHHHKYDHGHALILSGGVGRGGAARLAARGALRVGAGLVTLGCPPAALMENAGRLDAIMLASLADAEAMVAEIAARKVKAVCMGPGFGTGERLRAFTAAGLGRAGDRSGGASGTTHPTMVLDADALTEYREDPETLLGMLHAGCVLTPHEGEFGRLFPDILEKLKAPAMRGPAYSKVDATREAAARAGCVVLFKGPDTVIANPDGRCSINAAVYERAAPWLATAGSGDVLAGFITGLLARGLSPMLAAETGAWLHVECARKFGPGLIAEDLPEQLPAVFRDLGL
ncbi:MAG: NAD(P)H-hydrate dehydratase [Pseudomonadota bacterium]